jgi:hypothetical protein
VKPSDHPEFFRLPPPEGRSRESTIRLDAAGRFWHEGAPVEHSGMARAFASWISRHPDDGRYILNNGFDWTYFQVEQVPFFVLSVSAAEDGLPLLSLFDGSEEPLDPSCLWLENEQLYTKVKGRALTARFSRQAQIALGDWLREREDGSIALQIGSNSYDIRVGSPGP